MLDAAAVRGFRTGDNPARWRGHLQNLLAKPKTLTRGHHRGATVRPASRFHGPASCSAICGCAGAWNFAILTACRSGEVRGARWDEIDLAKAVWVIPGSRMKAGKEHRVPLSAEPSPFSWPLQEMRTGDFVFPGNASASRSRRWRWPCSCGA